MGLDIHLFGNDPEGIALVQQLQQRAEAWAEAGILSMIFTTDDYWPYETDLTTTEANNALRYLRTCYAPAGAINKARDNAQVPQVLHLLGGRISLLLRASKAPDMLGKSKFWRTCMDCQYD
jgi:hypothetical protein